MTAARAAYLRGWRQRNIARCRAYARESYRKHREHQRARCRAKNTHRAEAIRQWRQDNADRYRVTGVACARRWRRKHRARLAAEAREWRRKNPEARIAQQRKYYRENRAKCVDQLFTSRARRRFGGPVPTEILYMLRLLRALRRWTRTHKGQRADR